jgi:hypothetical protein
MPFYKSKVNQRVQTYSTTLSLILAVDGGGGLKTTLRPLIPEKEIWYPLYKRLGGPQGWSGQVRNISPTTWFDPRTVQPLASRFTDYNIPASQPSIYVAKIHVLYCVPVALRKRFFRNLIKVGFRVKEGLYWTYTESDEIPSGSVDADSIYQIWRESDH